MRTRSFDVPGAKTINEIVYGRHNDRRNFCSWCLRLSDYKPGDQGSFHFGTITRQGRITNVWWSGASFTYDIEGHNHTWYRGIAQQAIIK